MFSSSMSSTSKLTTRHSVRLFSFSIVVSESDVSFPDRHSCLASFSEQKKALELRTEIAKAEAEGLAYAEAEASCAASPTPSQIVVRRQDSDHHGSSEDTDWKLHIKSPNVKPEELNAAKPKRSYSTFFLLLTLLVHLSTE